MADVSTTTALSAFQQLFTDGTVRAHPVEGPSMEPTLYSGEVVGVRPLDRFECDGIYLLSVGGYPQIYRCQYNWKNGIDLKSDRTGFQVHATLTREEFNEHVLGRVVALCGNPDRPRGHKYWSAA